MRAFKTSTHRRGLLRTAAALTVPMAFVATGVVSAGTASAASAAPAATADVTPYTYSAGSYGSRVDAPQPGLRSAPATASGIGCTKAVGVVSSNTASTTDPNEQVHTGDVATNNDTYRSSTDTVGVRSLSRIASIRAGDSTLGLAIKGLEGLSTAYATKAGTLNARSTFSFDAITPTGAQAGSLPAPVKELLDGPVKGVLDQLSSGQSIVIPGLGVLQLGAVSQQVTGSVARSGSTGLQINLFGTNHVAGGGDDSLVILGSTRAGITRSATKGLFGGSANGVRATRADGTAAIGPQSTLSLPCEGTAGVNLTTARVGFNAANLDKMVVDGLKNTVYGKQNSPVGGRTGRTGATIDSVAFGSGLKITGIVSGAGATRSATGQISRTVTQKVASIKAGGKTYTVPGPGQSVTIPGVARIEVPMATRTSYGVQVTALRITLLDGESAKTVINLANTRTEIRTY